MPHQIGHITCPFKQYRCTFKLFEQSCIPILKSREWFKME